MMKKHISLLLVLVTGTFFAQPPKRFITHFGGTGAEFGNGIQLIDSSSYIVVGSTTSYGNGGTDVYLARLDSMGVPKWAKSYGGPAIDVGSAILVNPKDSGFVIVGYTSSFGTGDYDVYVIRTNKFGGKIWEKTLGSAEWDFGNDVILASDSEIIVCGNTYSGKYGKSDGYVAKLKMADGALMWERTLGGAEEDNFLKVKRTTDGYYTVAGNTKSYGDINNDFWLHKINDNGDSIKAVAIGTPSKAEYMYDFIEDKENNLVLCGSLDTSVKNTGRNIAYMIKTDPSGNVLKTKGETDGAHDDDKYVAIANARSGNLYLLCRKYNKAGFFGIQVHPMLWDYNFDFWYANDYGGVGIDEAAGAVNMWDNGFAIIGYTKSFDLPAADAFLVRLRLSLDSSNVYVVGEHEIMYDSRRVQSYYSKGFIYFENKSNASLEYKILDLRGSEILGGSTRENFINVKQLLADGLYLLRFKNSELPALKFVVNQ
jgi:hypothetical protein